MTTIYKKTIIRLLTSPAIICATLFLLLGSSIPLLFPDKIFTGITFTFRQYIARVPFLLTFIIPVMPLKIDKPFFPLPANDSNTVLGIFFAPLTVFIFMLTLTLPVLFFADPMDAGPVFSAYLLLFFFGGTALAFGQFLSDFFSSSVVSFIVTAGILLFLNTSQIIPLIIVLPQWAVLICTQISFAWHFEAANRGILDSRDFTFYLLPTIAFLYANRILLMKRRSNP